MTTSPEQDIAQDRAVSGLVVAGLSVVIGKTTIISETSFEARAGELLAVIGPSGSGKTTLLRAITGEVAYRGTISLAGQEVRHLSPRTQASMRGVLPQASFLSFPLTVSEVVALGLDNSSADRGWRSNRVKEALERVGLSGFGGRTYQDLSGGEQQRTHLARVLCQVWDPVSETGTARWLFLDEPVSSLDIKHQYQIMQLAKDYASRGGGVVAVLHDLNLTASFSDRCLVMKSGRPMSLGATREVLHADLLSRTYDIALTRSETADGQSYFLPELQSS
ncbi:MAG: heme ABC transporter ATP-binding protein [Pseudomonadota bacterium]